MSISKCHEKHIVVLNIIYFNKKFREVLKKNVPNRSPAKINKNIPISKIDIPFYIVRVEFSLRLNKYK